MLWSVCNSGTGISSLSESHQSKLNHLCDQLWGDANVLLNIAQKFAVSLPGDETDRYRSHARKIKLIIKQLISQIQHPHSDPSMQRIDLMQCLQALQSYLQTINISTHPLPPSQTYEPLAKRLFSQPHRLKEAEDKLRMIFSLGNSMANSITQLTKEIQTFKTISLSSIPKESLTMLLFLERSESLSQINISESQQFYLLEQVDDTKQILTQLIALVRTYIRLVYGKDIDSQLNFLALTTQIFTLGCRTISELVSKNNQI
jgi:hypothetical protein